EQFSSGLDERFQSLVGAGLDRQPAGLSGDERGQRNQLLAFPGERWRLLLLGAAAIDALLEIDRLLGLHIEDRIARGHPLHACRAAPPFPPAASPWQSAPEPSALPALRLHSASPSSTHSMPGFDRSSSCIAWVSRLMNE